jgi:hypothetical protein
MATDFMGIMGFKTMPVGASSTVSWANTRLRVALALDVTGSMAQGGKMPAMKTAAAKLVKTLSSSAVQNEDVYISVVPFAKDVNVGTQFVGAGWLDWTDWNAANQTCNNGGNHCTTNAKSTWNGCVTDRDEPYDTQNTAPTNSSTDFPTEQSGSCGPALLPLTYDFDAVNTKIDSLQPQGSTNQPIGLAWAWKTLSSGQPFAAPPKDSNFSYLTAIILLTDGLNTQQRNPTYGDGMVQFNGRIDARQKILCDNIKTDGVTVYTIQVNTDGEATSTVLPYCASSSDKFFMLTSADQIMSAFDTIGGSLQKLRISK